MLRRLGILLLYCIVIAAAAAQNEPPTATMILKAARVLDVKTGRYLENFGVVVQGQRIKELGPWNQVSAHAPDAVLVDLGGATLLPGLIESHQHLLSDFDRKVPEPANMILTVSQMDTAKRALLGARNARTMLEAGFTMVREMGNSSVNGDIALRDAINAGWVTGPRILASTRALSAAGGQFGRTQPQFSNMIDQEYVVISGPDEARRAVRNALYAGADLIKVIVDTTPRVLQYDEMKAIVDEAHRFKVKVAAHAVTNMAIKLSAEAGVDSIEHGYALDDENARLLHDKGIFLVPTDAPAEDYRDFFSGANLTAAQVDAQLKSMSTRLTERLQRARKAGGRIAAGSDMYYADPKRTRGQASLRMLVGYQEEGMPAPDIIRAATSDAAELLGWQDRVGSIEPGKFADIIAVNGDPLQNVAVLETVQFVMKGGSIVKNQFARK